MTKKTSFSIFHSNWIYMKNKLILVYILFFAIAVNIFAKEEKISLQLQWMDQFQFAGYYIAKEKYTRKSIRTLFSAPFSFCINSILGRFVNIIYIHCVDT